MANLIEQAIACDDGDRAARMIQEALGIESDDDANYVFPRAEYEESVGSSVIEDLRPDNRRQRSQRQNTALRECIVLYSNGVGDGEHHARVKCEDCKGASLRFTPDRDSPFLPLAKWI